jgi:hypothetical protein
MVPRQVCDILGCEEAAVDYIEKPCGMNDDCKCAEPHRLYLCSRYWDEFMEL